MARSLTHLRRIVFGASVTAALGLGAVEALAKPQPAATPPLCQAGYRLCKNCFGQWYCAVDTGECPPCELAK